MSRRPGDLILKDPDSIEPQGFDWTAWLAELGATISSSTWSVTPATSPALTLSSASIVTGNLRTQVKLSGGSLGVRYTVTNHIVADDGSEDDRSFDVQVKNR